MELSIEIIELEYSNESYVIDGYEIKEVDFTEDNKMNVVYQLKLKPEIVNIKFKAIDKDD